MDDAVIPPSAINWPVMVSPERLAFEDSSAPVEVAILLTCDCKAVEPVQLVAVVAVVAFPDSAPAKAGAVTTPAAPSRVITGTPAVAEEAAIFITPESFNVADEEAIPKS